MTITYKAEVFTYIVQNKNEIESIANQIGIYQTKIMLTLFSFVFLVKINTSQSLSIFDTKALRSINFSSKILRQKGSTCS